jgi:hypothetical protein
MRPRRKRRPSTSSQDTVQRSSTTRSSAATTEQRVFECARQAVVELAAHQFFAVARQQHVEESRFLPARFGEAEHRLRLRSDESEAAVGEIELEGDGARDVGDQALLLAAALEFGGAIVDIAADGFVGELQARGIFLRSDP